MANNFIKEYFIFTKNERIGIYTLLVIIFICIMLPFLFPFFIRQKKFDHGEFDKAISELKKREDTSAAKIITGSNYTSHYTHHTFTSGHSSNSSIEGELFYFDPNTISGLEWKRLGIRDKTISTIQKYLSRGGHFYKADDIRKIWGLHENEVNRIVPYIKIKDKKAPGSFYSTNNIYHNEYKPFHKIEQKPFDVNVADSAMLDSLPGIGPRLAKRILTFRDKLGGFFSVDQVKETYGLPDSTFGKIKARLFVLDNGWKRININICTLDQLKAHPYIRYMLANAIIQYRAQHGPFKALEDLKNIMVITDEIYNKIISYISVK